jgi:hypothetical protein
VTHAGTGHGLGGKIVGQVAELRRPASEQIQPVEIIDAEELAARLKLPKSWVMEKTRQRAEDGGDPIPHLKFGKYRRFKWGSPELSSWLARRANGKA